MRIRLEKRLTPSRFMQVATPIASVILTMALGAIIFQLIGFDGPRAIYETFITPVVASYKWQDVATKAAPLIIIALGLSLGNQAKIWNIGAEGQYIIGALAGAGVAFALPNAQGFWVLPLMIAAGVAGGMAWAAIPAFLKTRYRVSEVLSTLMLVYVALQVLNYLVSGPWKDPNGHNFPQTPPFTPAQLLPHVIPGTAIPPGLVVAIVLTLVFWLLATRSVYGFSVRTVGAAPSAARYGGFDASRTVWSTLHDQRRHGRTRRHSRGVEPAGTDQPRLSLRLRLHRDHRLVPRPPPSGRRLLRRADPRRHLRRRPGGANGGACAERDRRHLPGDDAVLHPRQRHSGPIPRADPSRRAACRPGGGCRVTLGFIIDALITVVGVTTPILLAATGELVVEKSGVLNLGIEGMMLIGAVTGFAVTFNYGPDLGDLAPWAGVIAAALASAASSMLFAFLVLTLGSNQVATGLALAIFGIGLSSLIGAGYVGMIVPSFNSVFPDRLASDPLWRVVFGYSPLVYFALIMVFAVGWFLNRTRAGLILRAVGENDLSAHSIGYPVTAIRYAAIAFGGALAGIGGAYFSMVITPMWAEQMTAGRGWIALALVVFSGWRAGRLLAGAYFFGVLMTLELYAKASGFSFLPSQFWAAMPYIAAVIALAVISAREVAGSEAPACLGRPFLPNS